MSEPEHCYKCDHIVTFCECDEPITEAWDALEYFRNENKALREANESLHKHAAILEARCDFWNNPLGIIKEPELERLRKCYEEQVLQTTALDKQLVRLEAENKALKESLSVQYSREGTTNFYGRSFEYWFELEDSYVALRRQLEAVEFRLGEYMATEDPVAVSYAVQIRRIIDNAKNKPPQKEGE